MVGEKNQKYLILKVMFENRLKSNDVNWLPLGQKCKQTANINKIHVNKQLTFINTNVNKQLTFTNTNVNKQLTLKTHIIKQLTF